MKPEIRIEYVHKRHSSAYIRNGEVILRISAYLSEDEKRVHTEQLMHKIMPKLAALDAGMFLLSNILETSRAEFVGQRMVDVCVSFGVRRMVIMDATKIVFKDPDVPKSTHLAPVRVHKEMVSLEKLIKALLAYARKYAQVYVEEVLAEWTDYFGYQRLQNVQIRHTESRWGSCSGRGNISISLKTLLLPEELFEYVCVHEVAHLQEMNHSARFWEIVASAMPHWKELRAEMKKYR